MELKNDTKKKIKKGLFTLILVTSIFAIIYFPISQQTLITEFLQEILPGILAYSGGTPDDLNVTTCTQGLGTSCTATDLTNINTDDANIGLTVSKAQTGVTDTWEDPESGTPSDVWMTLVHGGAGGIDGSWTITLRTEDAVTTYCTLTPAHQSTSTRLYYNLSDSGTCSDPDWTNADLTDLEIAFASGDGKGPTDAYIYFVDINYSYVAPNSPPTIYLNTSDNWEFGTNNNPSLNFTGIDPEADDITYYIEIYNASIERGDLVDHYYEGNGTFDQLMHGSGYTRMSQSFTGDGSTLHSVEFFLEKVGNPTGTVVAKLYSHSGVYGTSSVPGTLIDTSTTTLDISTIGSPKQMVEFNFSTGNVLESGTNYVMTVEISFTFSDATTNYINLGFDAISSEHSGNLAEYAGTWYAWSSRDLAFKVYNESYSYTQPALINASSESDTGFANTLTPADTDPFNSGDQINYTVQSGEELYGGLYFWRVSGRDPNGGNGTSSWTEARLFSITAAAGPDTTKPKVFLHSPANASTIGYDTESFNATFTDNIQLSNVTFYLWNGTGIVNTTFIELSGTSNYSNLTVTLPREDTYFWNYLAYDNVSNFAFNNSNYTLIYSTSTCTPSGTDTYIVDAQICEFTTPTTTGNWGTIIRNSGTLVIDGSTFTTKNITILDSGSSKLITENGGTYEVG